MEKTVGRVDMFNSIYETYINLGAFGLRGVLRVMRRDATYEHVCESIHAKTEPVRAHERMAKSLKGL